MSKKITKHSFSKTFLCVIAICAASFAAMNVQAQTYNAGDVAVVNSIISNNGLNWTTANPADGSYIPADWTGCKWSSDVSNKRITLLDVWNKSLTGTLDVSGLEDLGRLNCTHNQLSTLNLSGLVNLWMLECYNNQLTELNLTEFVNLELLYCNDNKLTDLDLTGLSLGDYDGSNQSVFLTMESNGTDYTAAVTLNTPTNLAAGLSYSTGVLTSNSNAILSSPFEVETGLAGKTLSGTLNFTYLELYVVTFAGEEISIPSQPILEGGKVSKPTNPERDNYDFGGWFTDSGTFQNEWNFETDVVTQDTTLYAKWTETVGISEIESAGVKIYPNPVKDELKIESGDLTIKKVEILDVTGKVVGNSSNVSALSQGIYFVKLETDKGVITRKFVKE